MDKIKNMSLDALLKSTRRSAKAGNAHRLVETGITFNNGQFQAKWVDKQLGSFQTIEQAREARQKAREAGLKPETSSNYDDVLLIEDVVGYLQDF